MSRRKRIEAVPGKGSFYAVFFHPVSQRTVRINLGDASVCLARRDELNAIFLDKKNWLNPPAGTSKYIRTEWLRHCGSSAGTKLRPVGLAEALDLQAEVQLLRQQVSAEATEARKWQHIAESALGRKVRTTALPTLGAARTQWEAGYTDVDPDHRKSVLYALKQFEQHFGAELPLDDLETRAQQIALWVRNLNVTPGTRAQYRRYVLRFLRESGVRIEEREIPAPTKHEVRTSRGPIRWLEKADAQAVAAALPEYFADCWRIQVALGLRPSEIITLHRDNFTELTSGKQKIVNVTLAPLGSLTLKNGTRTLQVPREIWAIAQRRIKECAVLFPHIPHAGWTKKGPELSSQPWQSEKKFYKRYREALQAVPKMPFALDCRTGRRTCGSLLLRAGHSVEQVATILGDRPETVREHYARILPQEVRATAGVLGAG